MAKWNLPLGLAAGMFVALALKPPALAFQAGQQQAASGQARHPSSPFIVSATKRREVKVTASRYEYTIHMGGTADMDNTTTRHYDTFVIAFQPNVELEIANTGSTPVVNPRVVINGRGRWWSIEELLKEILAGADSDQEKALLIWEFVRKHRHHDSPLFVGNELHDPVKLLNIYGAGLCDDSAAVGCSLLFHAGLNKKKYGRNPKVRHLHGHVMCEAYLNGRYQFLDIDENTFYLDRENERIVSGDEVARDHDLARREQVFGPLFQGWDVGQRAAALFGSDDGAGFLAVAGHRMDLTLRPGERIVFRWDNVGKVASDGPKRLRFWGNSRLVYCPSLALSAVRRDAEAVEDIAKAKGSGPGRIAGTSTSAALVYRVSSPYVLCGGRVRAQFVGTNRRDRFAVELSTDGEHWQPLWRESGIGVMSCRLDLDEALAVHKRPPKYRYFVRLALSSASPGSAQLAELRLETDLMASPLALPRLRVGDNRVAYTDQTPGPHQVTIRHRWRESGNVQPPAPPRTPVFPPDGAVVRRSTFAFRWPAGDGVAAYHLQVSRYPDMKLPYRPTFDCIVEQPTYGPPFTGLFSPDTDYYWRVRCRNKAGLWGPWSSVWRFRWQGPRVPVKLRVVWADGGRAVLYWEPNPRGPRPAAYDVYGSDERGFSVSKNPYLVRGLGKQPPNFLGRTTGTEMVIVDPDPDHSAMNRCFYRVVAIDDRGTESGPSDYVELPHPHLYSRPVTRATVGRLYRYQARTLRCLGDLQHRYTPPNQAFWEREEYRFELTKGPQWLKIDPGRGELSGTPGADDVGQAEVEITVRRGYPHEVKPSDRQGRLFQKTADRFQAADRQRFRIRVTAQGD